MLIIGAGISGLLAGQYFRHLEPRILEKQSKLPNNHKALLRFRSDCVSQMTAIPFKKVTVTKEVIYDGESVPASIKYRNMYSRKVTGGITGRSLAAESCERYIAPDDFIQKLSNGLHIEYGIEFREFIIGKPIISTMPTWDLATLLNYDLEVELETMPIWTATCEIIDCDVYQTIYFPDPDSKLYRASITGSKLILEYNKPYEPTKDYILTILYKAFGIRNAVYYGLEYGHQEYGKLIECDGDEVRKFMRYATDEFGVYSLGRWATHRQILADDVVHDIHVIDRMIRSGGYSR